MRMLSKNLWQRWLIFSKRVAEFQSRVILSLFYFTFVMPFALAIKLFSDPLGIKYKTGKSYWLPKRLIEDSLKESRRQF